MVWFLWVQISKLQNCLFCFHSTFPHCLILFHIVYNFFWPRGPCEGFFSCQVHVNFHLFIKRKTPSVVIGHTFNSSFKKSMMEVELITDDCKFKASTGCIKRAYQRRGRWRGGWGKEEQCQSWLCISDRWENVLSYKLHCSWHKRMLFNKLPILRPRDHLH